MKNLPTVIPVVAAALIDAKGRILLQRRSPGRTHAGLWEFPGGKVENGESLESALIREFEEELAIRLDPDSLAPLCFSSAPGQRFVVLLYTCREWAGDPRPLDADALGWFSAQELASLPLVPLDVPLADAVIATLERLK